MTLVQAYPPGAFCWLELATADVFDSKRFYGGLFGWEFQNMAALAGGCSVGGLHPIGEEDDVAGVRPGWESYISVSNLADAAGRAVSLGASVLQGPRDARDLGKTAVLGDPEGARFGLWQPGRHFGAERVKEPGAMAWNELASRDPAKATSFYAALFGWTPKVSVGEETGVYTDMLDGAVPVCGILSMPEAWGDVPPFWLGYFAVEECEAAIDRAIELGGSLEYGPMDIPGLGRHAVIADPQLALFAIVQRIQSRD